MAERIILSERSEDDRAAAEWWMEQARLLKKGDEITQRLAAKYASIILSRNETGMASSRDRGGL